MIWKEFWYGRNTEETYKPPIFKVPKTNLPKNHKTHNGLKTYLGAIKSEIMDHQNRNKVKSNLPEDEIEALKELIVLQKDHKIMIKQCDKGAGIMILNFQDYIEACDKHVEAKQCDIDGNEKAYYKPVDEDTFIEAKHKIRQFIEEGLDNEIITKQEYEARCPESKQLSKFYCNFKVHKPHEH